MTATLITIGVVVISLATLVFFVVRIIRFLISLVRRKKDADRGEPPPDLFQGF